MSIVGPRPQTPRCFDAFPVESQIEIKRVRPGLSGLGPIIFRDENILSDNYESLDFYDNVIAPYKGDVEAYYTRIISIISCFKVIFITLRSLFFLNLVLFEGFPIITKTSTKT